MCFDLLVSPFAFLYPCGFCSPAGSIYFYFMANTPEGGSTQAGFEMFSHTLTNALYKSRRKSSILFCGAYQIILTYCTHYINDATFLFLCLHNHIYDSKDSRFFFKICVHLIKQSFVIFKRIL